MAGDRLILQEDGAWNVRDLQLLEDCGKDKEDVENALWMQVVLRTLPSMADASVWYI